MSETLWTCKGCGVSVTTEEGPMEQLARGNRPRKEGDLRWVGGDRVHYWMTFEYVYGERPGGEEPTETPLVTVDEHPYCPGCAQPCANCGTGIFSRLELEAGDTYAAGSAFLPEGKYGKDEALCVDCFSECCDTCGASPTEECTCHDENGQDSSDDNEEEEEEEAHGS